MKIDKVYNENCLDTMARMEDGFIDLTVTSPPYDNLRTYNGFSFDFEKVAKELFRVTKDGGVVVWVVGDATIDGSETGTSFRQALFFMECGFKLHDTMIWTKDGGGAVGSNKCYTQNFEYMFVFSKGDIKTFNLIYDKKNNSYNPDSEGVKVQSGRRTKEGIRKVETRKQPKEFSRRNNWWVIQQGTHGEDSFVYEHPAMFPEQLAKDHIISWSNEHDLVYDPFMGSGTTGKCAKDLVRHYIGSEISAEYTTIANKRIASIAESLFM